MADPTAFAMSQMFSQLTGRSVSFSLVPKAPTPKAKPLYGVYRLDPGDAPLVVKTEMALIGSCGGALLGLPKDSVLERLKETALDEVLRDAMQEVLNVAAARVSVDRRAIFENMYTDPIYLNEAAQEVLRTPFHTAHFDVAVDGYVGGGFSVMT